MVTQNHYLKRKKGEEDLELAAATGAGNVVISAEGEDKMNK